MGISDRRQREKEQRKTEIADAAGRLFFPGGMKMFPWMTLPGRST